MAGQWTLPSMASKRRGSAAASPAAPHAEQSGREATPARTFRLAVEETALRITAMCALSRPEAGDL